MESNSNQRDRGERNRAPVIEYAIRMLTLIAACFVLTGGVAYLHRSGYDTVDYRVFKSHPVSYAAIGTTMKDALSIDPAGIMMLGIFVLIAVPLFRVAFLLLSFAVHRDWIYSLMSGIVLAILLFSLFGKGIAG